MINFKDVTLSQASKVLIEQANFSLTAGMKIGLIGRNGCGKSSLFAAIKGYLESTAGEIKLQNDICMSYIEQETPGLAISAIDFVASGDSQVHALNQQIITAQQMGKDDLLIKLYNKLEDLDGFTVLTRAAKILSGLGFEEHQLDNSVAEFSGGWRMRLNIAKCLMERSNLLLLDEPTNHLDLETVYWLEKWLVNYKGCLVVISHDRNFLDQFTNKILHIEHKKINFYSGNYSDFERLRAESIKTQNALHEKQQAKIAHMMNYVNRFRAKSSKAKQAQSRLKAIDKLEAISKVQLDSPFYFEFLPPPQQPTPLVSLYKATLGYTADDDIIPILDNVSFSLEPGSRIGLLGKNGSGKSTLIQSMTGDLPLLDGEYLLHPKTNIGYFHQNLIDYLQLDDTMLEMFYKLPQKTSTANIRGYLGGFNFSGDIVNQKIGTLSGGEKTRLALAAIILHKPNLLLLDEPTNHLDLDMRESLAIALQSYSGAVVIVSHDQHLLETTVDRVFYISDGALHEYLGDIQEYLRNYQKLSQG